MRRCVSAADRKPFVILQTEADDAGNGPLTARFLTIPQHLTEKGLQHIGSVMNVLLAEQPAVPAEDSSDLLGGQDGPGSSPG